MLLTSIAILMLSPGFAVVLGETLAVRLMPVSYTHLGRAKSLMERAVGFQDAGATSVALLFGAMRKWCEEA